MLVLTRGCEQSIVIGNNVTVTVLEIIGGRVKLGIEADPSILIMRKEIAGNDAETTGTAGGNARQ